MKFKIEWHEEERFVKDLTPHVNNPRRISKEKIKELKESLEEIGYAQSININLDDANTILSGHARYYVLSAEKIEKVMVMVPNRVLTSQECDSVLIRMNRNVAGEWNFDILADKFDMDFLEHCGFDKSEFGMTPHTDDYSDKNKEIDTDNFGNDLNAMCPKCNFEFQV